MPTSTIFQGKVLIQPQAVSAIDDSALSASNVAGSATVGIVGASTGGAPNTALAFTKASDAVAMLRSGALLDCVRKAFDPGAGTPGAPKVIAVRIATPLQSSLTIQDSAPANTIVLTAVDYGAWTNQIRVTVAAATTAGKKLTVAAPNYAGTTQTVSQDNVYLASFSILYTGAGSASTMTITSTAITTSCTGAAGDNVNFLFATYPTMQQMVDAFNATGKYTTGVLAGTSDATNQLDGASAVDIKSATYNATSTLQACITFFNNSGLVTGARSTGILPPAVIGATYLTAGSDGSAVTNTDYTNGLQVLENQDVGIVSVSSGTAAVHALAATHVTNMSGTAGKKERMAILGGVLGETVAQTTTRASNLSNLRVAMVYPGVKDYDINGTLTSYDPFVSAAYVAGVLAGAPVTEAATNKAIGVVSLTNTTLLDADYDTLLLGGALPIRAIPGRGIRVIQSITTYTADGTLSRVEVSVRRNADYVARSVRDALADIVGKTSGPALVALLQSRVNSVLRQLDFDGFIVGTASNPSFKNVQVTVSGSVATVQFTASIGVPANYVEVVAHLAGFSATS